MFRWLVLVFLWGGGGWARGLLLLYFVLCILKMLVYFLLASINICHLCVLFLFLCFSSSFLNIMSLIFNSFTMICVDVVSFVFNMLWVISIWGSLYALDLSILLLPNSFSFPFWTLVTQILDLLNSSCLLLLCSGFTHFLPFCFSMNTGIPLRYRGFNSRQPQ